VVCGPEIRVAEVQKAHAAYRASHGCAPHWETTRRVVIGGGPRRASQPPPSTLAPLTPRSVTSRESALRVGCRCFLVAVQRAGPGSHPEDQLAARQSSRVAGRLNVTSRVEPTARRGRRCPRARPVAVAQAVGDYSATIALEALNHVRVMTDHHTAPASPDGAAAPPRAWRHPRQHPRRRAPSPKNTLRPALRPSAKGGGEPGWSIRNSAAALVPLRRTPASHTARTATRTRRRQDPMDCRHQAPHPQPDSFDADRPQESQRGARPSDVVHEMVIRQANDAET